MNIPGSARISWISIVVIWSAAITFALLVIPWFGKTLRVYELVSAVLLAAVLVAALWPGSILKKIWVLANIAAYGIAAT